MQGVVSADPTSLKKKFFKKIYKKKYFYLRKIVFDSVKNENLTLLKKFDPDTKCLFLRHWFISLSNRRKEESELSKCTRSQCLM